MALFKLISRILLRIESAMAVIGALTLAVIASVILVDTLLRYFFGRPFSWAYELVGAYLMVAAFFTCLPLAFTVNHHIRADILRNLFSIRSQRVQEILTCLLSAALFGLISYVAFLRFVESYIHGERVGMEFHAPAWPTSLLVALGAGLLTLRLLVFAFGHLATIVTGRVFVDLPVGFTASEISEIQENVETRQ